MTSAFSTESCVTKIVLSKTNVPFCYSEVGRDSVFEQAGNPAPQCVVHLRHDKSLPLQPERKSIKRDLTSRVRDSNPSQVIFRSLPVSESSGGSRNSQSCDVNFTHVDSPCGFTRIFILHEDVHATRVVTSEYWIPHIKKEIFLGIRPK